MYKEQFSSRHPETLCSSLSSIPVGLRESWPQRWSVTQLPWRQRRHRPLSTSETWSVDGQCSGLITHTHTHSLTQTHTLAQTRTHIHTHKLTQTHTLAQTHTHTHSHIHTHTHTLLLERGVSCSVFYRCPTFVMDTPASNISANTSATGDQSLWSELEPHPPLMVEAQVYTCTIHRGCRGMWCMYQTYILHYENVLNQVQTENAGQVCTCEEVATQTTDTSVSGTYKHTHPHTHTNSFSLTHTLTHTHTHTHTNPFSLTHTHTRTHTHTHTHSLSRTHTHS